MDSHALARCFLDTVPPLLHSMGSEIRDVAAEGQVTMAQFRTMALLHQRGSLSLTNIAEAHEVSAPSISRLISTLVERGWVSREPDASDRRQVVITLTERGHAFWQRMAERGSAHLAVWLDELSEEESAALAVALVGLARVVQQRRAAHGLPALPPAVAPQ